MKYFLWLLLCITVNASAQNNLPLNLLKLPPGFVISVYASDITNAREMALGQKAVFVGSMSQGNVYAIIPDKNQPNGTKIITIASGLKKPNGLAFKDGALYVATVTQLLRYDDIESHLDKPISPKIIYSNFPDKGGHNWRTIGFGPDNKLYISIGAPCNVCLEKNEQFATIIRMNPDGTAVEVFAKGIRDSVGFDWDPRTQKLWFTDNGRDWLGDNIPPDEINYAPQPGLNFGFPFCHGVDISDPMFGKDHPCSLFTAPVGLLPAHVAALNMLFYSGKMFPAEYQNQIFITEHGSWNRSTKVGYQVVIAKTSNNKVIEIKPFVTGWLHDGKVWGRPVGLLQLQDGSLLISDDLANVIYRVTYQKARHRNNSAHIF